MTGMRWGYVNFEKGESEIAPAHLQPGTPAAHRWMKRGPARRKIKKFLRWLLDFLFIRDWKYLMGRQ